MEGRARVQFRSFCQWRVALGIMVFVGLTLPARLSAQVLVVSPHPDDDVITSSGVVKRAVQRGESVQVAFVSNGDFNSIAEGNARQGESVTAQSYLGVAENQMMFLGYPDGYLSTIRSLYTSSASIFTSPNGVNHTYASRGLGGTDYHQFQFGSHAPYNWPAMVDDLSAIISAQRPVHIFTTSQWDTHGDHATTYFLVVEAALRVIAANPGYNPTVHKTTVWPGDLSWPGGSNPYAYFSPMPRTAVSDPSEMVWAERESLDVPSAMQSALAPSNPKYAAIQAHVTQGGADRYIGEWAHKDEVFWTEQLTGTNKPPVPAAGLDQLVAEGALVMLDGTASWDRNGSPVTYLWRQVGGPAVTLSSTTSATPTFSAPTGLADDAVLEFELVVSDASLSTVPDAVRVTVRSALNPQSFGANVAPQATFSASSEREPSGQTANKVADGVIDGYPHDSSREWVTAGEGVNAWIQMNWATPVTIGKVVIYDRLNNADQILTGTIQFSDGSTLAVGPLSNNATPTEDVFSARTVTSLRLTVTQVTASTTNVGLAEFQVFAVGAGNSPPVAVAGPNQTVAGSSLVTLNGSGSSDPDSDPLTFSWTQISGPSVTLSNPTTATPTFTAPAATPGSQTLRFSLVVSDGLASSSPSTVDIFIPGTANAPPVADAGPDFAASAGANATLNGTASTDPEGQPLTYQWTQIAGTTVTLSNVTSATPTFTLASSATNETLTFRLIVSDGSLASAADTVNVSVVALPGPTDSIASTATVTASSERAPTQGAIKAVDGVVDGFPGDSSREWVTVGEGAGAWIELNWPDAHLVSRVRLHDRPNLSDYAATGTLTFSDGSSVAVGPLNNDGSVLDVVFVPRQIRWVRFTVNTVGAGTGNVGLAEFFVFQQSGSSSNEPPIAAAGPDQLVAGGTVVQLNGTGSSDPEGAALTFAWTQLTGPAVVIAGPASATPTFTAPPALRQIQVLRFQLVVGDGTQTSGDTTDVTVASLPNSAPLANAGPDQTVATSALVQLDGRGSSDPDADPINYHWTQLAGPPVTLTGATSAQPTFTTPAASGHTHVFLFRLVVDDGVASSTADVVAITMTAPPNSSNIASLATVTASSEVVPSQTAVKAIDGIVSGYPALPTAEWVTNNERAGAWIQLDWPTSRNVNLVRLYDRPNPDDQVLTGTLLFSDGSSIAVGALPNSDESSLDVSFATKTVSWVRFRVDTVRSTTSSVGLAEIDVIEPPAITISSASATEGGAVVFTLTLSKSVTQQVSVNYATANGSATAGQDYTADSATVTFAPGATSATISVPTLQDTLDEINETFVVNLSGAVNATIATAQATGTITDNDPAPSLSIGDVTVTETNTGTNVNAVFTVTLSAESGQTVTVNYATADGTAVAPQDYTAGSGTLSFAPGVTSRTVTVPVIGDALDEANETFVVNLSGPVNATVSDAQATGTITDNDAAPSLAIGDVTVTETNTGTNVNAVFTVTLSAASGRTVTVNYATANGTATAPQDYTATTGTALAFTPGVTSRTITVPVIGDALDEANETFVVNLSGAVNATIADTQATGTITDNDATPTLSIADVSVTEGNTGTVNATFTVVLSAASGLPVSINLATANGTAVINSDYQGGSGTLTLDPGTTSYSIPVPILPDLLDEANETFFINMSSPVNATVPDAQATITIVDNDPAPSLAINNVTVTETNTGTNVNAVFTVTLSVVSGQAVTVNYATANGSATASQDFTGVSGTLTFAAGTTSRTITVPVIGDTRDEVNETFVVNLSGAANATIADSQGAGTINDNDPAPSLTINSVSLVEPDSGSVNLVFTVTLSAASGQTVTVNYATANGTATAGSDYSSRSGTLTFAAGVTTQTISVPVLGDTFRESNQTFVVNLTGAVNATIATAQGTGTIINDD